MSATYLNIPFSDKDHAKALGAQWDKENKLWYCKTEERSKFDQWPIVDLKLATTKTFLSVKFDDKEAVKKLGAKWDADRKQWYCLGDPKPFSKWT